MKRSLMANTYTQLYVQLVFAVKFRKRMISEELRDPLEKYICGIAKSHKTNVLAIYINPDHAHILESIDPSVSIADLTNKIKTNSSRWINENNWFPQKFRWQNGYGAFSYSKSHVDGVIRYILTQPEHHRKRKFKSEYLHLLNNREIEFNDEYLFDWLD